VPAYLLRRALGALAVLLILSAVIYGIFYLLPADPARLVCGCGAVRRTSPP